jgi:uncharacterized protein YdaU (DUF1376 family)
MNWYKWNVAEYHRLTKDMPDAEDLAFRRMLDWCYLREGPLPLDHHELEVGVGLEWSCIEPILKKFFRPTPSGYVNDDVQADIVKRISRTQVLRNSGKKGGRPKKVA